MKKHNRNNPVAKSLRGLGKKIIPDKRRDKEAKRLTKEVRDAKTTKD